MYYHCRELKYTIYDKIGPAPESIIDKNFLQAYRWLSKYLPGNYCPQIWLSRSKSCYTGYTSPYKAKQTKTFGKRLNREPHLMFGFDIIKGFPVDYALWCHFLNPLINCKDGLKDGDKVLAETIKQWVKDAKDENLPDDRITTLWKKYGCLKAILDFGLFVEHDQVVVPALNLKAAKVVYCRNEAQVKELLHMGFIRDRVKIMNSKLRDF